MQGCLHVISLPAHVFDEVIDSRLHNILGTGPLSHLVCDILQFSNDIKDDSPESTMFSTHTNKEKNKDEKQNAEFINRKAFKKSINTVETWGLFSLPRP